MSCNLSSISESPSLALTTCCRVVKRRVLCSPSLSVLGGNGGIIFPFFSQQKAKYEVEVCVYSQVMVTQRLLYIIICSHSAHYAVICGPESTDSPVGGWGPDYLTFFCPFNSDRPPSASAGLFFSQHSLKFQF